MSPSNDEIIEKVEVTMPDNKKHRVGSMRATICPNAIILTKANRAAASADGRGEYCDLSTASEVFLIFTTQINAQFRHLKCTIVKD